MTWLKTAWEKASAVYEWAADIVADYPKIALAAILILAMSALF